MSTDPQKRRRAWQALVAGMAAFALVYAAVQAVRLFLFSYIVTTDAREIVLLRAFTSLLLIWGALGAVLLIARKCNQGIRQLGWRRRSPVSGWIAAFVVVVLYCGFTLMGPALRHVPILTDWSLFRVGTALAIGLSAGFCEETIFRGFVMTQAREGGAGPLLQMVLSAVLFGLAHLGWGGLTGTFQLWAMIASVIATLILGAMLAVTYLIARRSLMPVIAAHAIIDMVIEPWLLLFMVSRGRFG